MKLIQKNRASRDIPIDIVYATSFFKRLKGLMFQKSPIKSKALYLAPCNSIHMLFMFFPIDAVFLDKEMRVVKIAPGLKPWKSTAIFKDAHAVIEFPEGTISAYSIQENDIILF